MSIQRPSVGRSVHFVSRGSKDGVFPPAHRAAVITEVVGSDDESGNDVVNLYVMNPTGSQFEFGVLRDELTFRPGSFHFQEYVASKESQA